MPSSLHVGMMSSSRSRAQRHTPVRLPHLLHYFTICAHSRCLRPLANSCTTSLSARILVACAHLRTPTSPHYHDCLPPLSPSLSISHSCSHSLFSLSISLSPHSLSLSLTLSLSVRRSAAASQRRSPRKTKTVRCETLPKYFVTCLVTWLRCPVSLEFS